MWDLSKLNPDSKVASEERYMWLYICVVCVRTCVRSRTELISEHRCDSRQDIPCVNNMVEAYTFALERLTSVSP